MTDRVVITVPSAYFRPHVAYDVARWLDGVPRVRNDTGGWTWLINPRTWAPAPETAVSPRDELRARYRASRARQGACAT